MFKEMAAIASLMKNLPVAVEKANDLKTRLANMRIEGEHHGVHVVVTGDHRIVSVQITEQFHTEGDRAQLEHCITAACNMALGQARDVVAKEMGSLASGLGVSGLSDTLAGLGWGRP